MIGRLFPEARFWARRDYFAAAEKSSQAWDHFADTTSDPLCRVHALMTMADCERTMANTVHGFSDAGERDKDGFTRAQSHGMAATLVDLVAVTESAYCHTAPPGGVVARWQSRVLSNLDIDPGLAADPEVGGIIGDLCVESDPGERAALVLRLWAAVVDQVGGQAAEVLPGSVACGYYVLSGMSLEEACWHTHSDGGERS